MTSPRLVSMSERAVFNLVPEIALIESLPAHLQKRFAHALQLMHERLVENLSWEQIALQSAISPYHFHRQFSELFNETPGQYLGRLRLQVAVNLLLSDSAWSVMDIAQHCGYSSSQALGKALKRELGVTAKYIRQIGKEYTPQQTADFIAKLAHPGEQQALETTLANAMPIELVWYPKRGMKKLRQADADWDSVFATYGKKSERLMGATPILHTDKRWDQIETVIGDWQISDARHDFTVPEGYYLCADVYLVSDVGYSAALEALFSAAKQRELTIDRSSYLIEMVRDIELEATGGVVISFQLPIMLE
uniref:helix-turn-helix transcriptional regulator n=1 Tax=Thaumasiovibrio occultus TaxID=1891184 RepID=UPI000B34FFD6|nr:AraC family transcriptional regulator [Thaumasiovibrio occultus]